MEIGCSIDEAGLDILEVVGVGEIGYPANGVSGRDPVVDNVVLDRS
jgi:hypothetical protein